MRHDVKDYRSPELDGDELVSLQRAVSSQLGAFRFSGMEPCSDPERALILPVSRVGATMERAAAKAPSPAAPVAGAALSRLIDLSLALALIAFLAPVFVIVSVLVFVLDPGPVIFRHERIGKGGRRFGCLKFRTMAVGAEQKLELYLRQNPAARRQWMAERKLSPDPRITPVGKWLRLTSLDELPQLFNVVKGDMSLIGPRPIVEDELVHYGRYAAHYLRVRPGLSGLWQVSGRSQTTYRRRVAADVLYVRRMSVAFDLSIMLATIPAVLTGKGSA